jgi:aspartate aminotransferase-like enzyme
MKLFIPGPVQVREEILKEMSRPQIGHRTEEFQELFLEVKKGLKYIFQTKKDVLVSTSSGSGLWEAAIRNCVPIRGRVLHAVNGAFSKKWADVSRRCGCRVDTIEFAFGEPINPYEIAKRLEEQEYSMFCMVHNETSTGVASDLSTISDRITDAVDAGMVWTVDAVSSIGGMDINVDKLGIDICLASSQKAMALPPGISFASVSNRAYAQAEKADTRGYYFDFIELKKSYDKNMTPYTPSIPHLYALKKQLEFIRQEGLSARFERHKIMAMYARNWVKKQGLRLFSEEKYCSQTITCVENTRSIDMITVKEKMHEKGYFIDGGYRGMNKILADRGLNQTFRIPHMGDLTIEDLSTFLEELKKVIC